MPLCGGSVWGSVLTSTARMSPWTELVIQVLVPLTT